MGEAAGFKGASAGRMMFRGGRVWPAGRTAKLRPLSSTRARPPMNRFAPLVLAVLAAALLCAAASAAHAQSIEPRAYSNAPVGVNFLIAGYASRAAACRSTPLCRSPIPAHRPRRGLGLRATLDVWGKSGKFDVDRAYTLALRHRAYLLGEPVQRDVDGFGDPLFRLSVNLYGAPALSLAEFKSLPSRTSSSARACRCRRRRGSTIRRKLVNLGMNRWFVKPELGVSKALGPLTLEGKAAVTLFTTNDDFFNGGRRAQDPLYSAQGHVIYNFPHGMWGSGRRDLLHRRTHHAQRRAAGDLQQNWRAGATLAIPVDVRNSSSSTRAPARIPRTGNSFDLIGIAWQYRWGGGI